MDVGFCGCFWCGCVTLPDLAGGYHGSRWFAVMIATLNTGYHTVVEEEEKRRRRRRRRKRKRRRRKIRQR